MDKSETSSVNSNNFVNNTLSFKTNQAFDGTWNIQTKYSKFYKKIKADQKYTVPSRLRRISRSRMREGNDERQFHKTACKPNRLLLRQQDGRRPSLGSYISGRSSALRNEGPWLKDVPLGWSKIAML